MLSSDAYFIEKSSDAYRCRNLKRAQSQQSAVSCKMIHLNERTTCQGIDDQKRNSGVSSVMRFLHSLVKTLTFDALNFISITTWLTHATPKVNFPICSLFTEQNVELSSHLVCGDCSNNSVSFTHLRRTGSVVGISGRCSIDPIENTSFDSYAI